jgi:hypothetical protein
MFIVWGPVSFVVICLVAWFVLSSLAVATAPKCPYCKGIVNRGASMCVNCGSDIPVVAPSAIERLGKTEISRQTAAMVIALLFGAPFALGFLIIAFAPDPSTRHIGIGERMVWFCLGTVATGIVVWTVRVWLNSQKRS